MNVYTDYVLIGSGVCLLVYLYYTWLFYQGLKNRKPEILVKKASLPAVSVIIAARNEARNLPQLLTCLMSQSYPADKYEVIIADDASTDDTAKIIKDYQNNFPGLVYHQVTDRDKVISYKKNALIQAINLSKNEYILLTDGDCLVTPNWINSMVNSFEKGADFIVGLSTTWVKDWNKTAFVQKYEYFDCLQLFGAAAGAICAKKYFSCSGQNLAYRKSDYREVGGLEKIKHLLSGDDVNLMQLFRKSGKKIVFNFEPSSFVLTRPIGSLKSLVNQRSRWASNMKWQVFLNLEMFLYLSTLFILLLSIFYLLYKAPGYAIVILLIKFFNDLIYMNKVYQVFQSDPKRRYFFPLFFIFQPIYLCVVGILGQLNFFQWKKKVK